MSSRWSDAPLGGHWLDKTAHTPVAASALRGEVALLNQLPVGLFATVSVSSDADAAMTAPGPGGFAVRLHVPFPQRLDTWLASHAGACLQDLVAGLRLCRALARCVQALHSHDQPDKGLHPSRFFVPADALAGDACLAELGRLSHPGRGAAACRSHRLDRG